MGVPSAARSDLQEAPAVQPDTRHFLPVFEAEYVILSEIANIPVVNSVNAADDSPGSRTLFAAENTVVVIPTFNERANIAQLVAAIFASYPQIRILIVDDHSPDGTADVVREVQLHAWCGGNLLLLERLKSPGFAASYRDGFRQVLAEPWCRAVITMDADFSHNPSVIRYLLDKLAGHDVVVGSRYTAGGSVEHWNLRRRLLSRTANLYVRAALGLRIHDATSGFMCLRREALESVPHQTTASEGYAFVVELKYLLYRAGYRIAEYPIAFDERREGQSKMSMGKIWESVWMPWRIRALARSSNLGGGNTRSG